MRTRHENAGRDIAEWTFEGRRPIDPASLGRLVSPSRRRADHVPRTLIRTTIDAACERNEARPFRDGAMAVDVGARRGIQPLGERSRAPPAARAAPRRSLDRPLPRPLPGLFANVLAAVTPFLD